MLKLFDKPLINMPPVSEEELDDQLVLDEIVKLKEDQSNNTVVVGHHYQQDDIIRFADITGDSLQLAQKVAEIPECEYIVFCGVHFMAETADMLTKPHQKVILPDLNAGCSMADMAGDNDIETAWAYIHQHTNDKVIPITYINCSANLKAFVGKNDGAICTSSNAEKMISWALSQGEKLLFFPDQHLGRNTCHKLGIKLEEMVLYNPHLPDGGLTPSQIKNAKVILWYGYCSVHQGFNVSQVKKAKKEFPNSTVIVHPECSFDVVQASDLAGSTSYIIQQIKNAPNGSHFFVGTEINLVNRLAKQFPDKKIQSLSPFQCLCTTMYRVRPRWLLESFRSIQNRRPINVISVDKETTKYSLLALDRMLENSQ